MIITTKMKYFFVLLGFVLFLYKHSFDILNSSYIYPVFNFRDLGHILAWILKIVVGFASLCQEQLSLFRYQIINNIDALMLLVLVEFSFFK